MCRLVDFAKPLYGEVGVDLGRREAGVSQHFLYDTQVSPVFDKMRCERVPESVWGDRYISVENDQKNAADVHFEKAFNIYDGEKSSTLVAVTV